jgi:gliding motility-associated-like protein
LRIYKKPYYRTTIQLQLNSMKHRFVYILLFALLLSGISVLIATRQGGDPVPNLSPEPSDLRFIKNEGQWTQDFDYLLRLTGGNVLLSEEGLTYSLYELPKKAHPHGARSFGEKLLKKEEDDLIQGHVLKVDFVGANPQTTIQPAQRFPEYHNYFLGDDPSRWKGEVPLFGLLTYEELYPGIDLKMYGDGDNVKYDLLVAPGADPDDIRFRYTGAESLKLIDGALHIKTSVREIVEDPPLVYQEIDGRKQRVRCNYRLKGNELSFVFPKGYDPNYALVIDPTLVFSTYTGARADNWGFTATYDNAGNLYGGGIIFAVGGGITSFPVTPGAYQIIYGGGGTECTISKFSADGSSMVYATYLGGSLWDQPQSLFVNDRNELYVYGRTSSTNFPTTLGAYDRNYNGGRFDIFVTKFNAAGTQLLGSTYLGGSDSDGENGNYFNSGFPPITLQANYGDDARGEIILDEQSFCYIAAPSRSIDFPTTTGALQPNRGGSQDAIVVKLTPDLTSLVFSTYLGGTGNDAAYGMKLDDQLNVYVTGGTSSPNFPTTSGALYTSYRGGTVDGFISKISANGRNLLNSTFIGTNAYDQSYFLELDEEYNVYVTGQTKGNFPVIGNVYSVPNSRQFISKLENDLSGFIYSTTFGVANAADPNISPTAFLVDRCDNVYVSGWGGSTNFAGNTRNLPTTPDAIQRNTDGSDFYMIVLERNARNLLYATYLGGNNAFGSGEHVDGGTCRFDREGIVYHAVCAGCGGFSTFPTTPGVVSTTNNSANCNLAAFKIEFDLAGIKAEFLTRDRNGDTLEFRGCPPLFANFDNQSKVTPQTRYFWDFGDGSPTATQRDPAHTFRDPGTYQVRLIIEDSASCNIRDTTFANILVYPRPTLTAGPDEIICEGDSVQITGSGDPSVVGFQWSPAGNILNRDSSSAVVFPPNDAQYILTVTDTNGCRARDTLQISIDRSLIVNTRPDTIVCEGVTAPLYASTNGVSYAWSPGNVLLDSTNLRTIASPDTTTTFYLTVLNARGCEEIDSTRIEVFEVYTLEDTSICIGDTIQMTTTNGVSFSWRPAYNMDDPNAVSPFIWPLVDTLYTVRAVSSDGCISEKGVVVDVDPLPIADAGIPDSICVGGATQLLATGGVLFNWYPANNMDDSTRANPTVSPAQTQYYYVTVTDEKYCSQDDSVLVWVDPLPTITAGPQSTICFGESIQLFASGGVSYRWAPNPTLSALDVPNPIASPTQPSLYVVSGTDDNGCTNDTTVAIDLVLPPEVDIDGENFLCVGGEIELTAEGGQRVRWSTGDTSRTIGVTPTGPTTFYATAFIGLCEGETDSITVDVNFDYPTASFDYEPPEGWAPQPVQFNNTSQNAATFLWNFGTGAKPNEEENPLFTFPHAGTWQVMMIAYSKTGCPDTAFGEVNLENVALHVPSAFTPNGDNTNDQWYVGYYGIRSLNVRVFSRWGMLIYESNDPDFRWDGTYKGGQVPEGVYVYVISGIGENELDYQRTGTVTVIR